MFTLVERDERIYRVVVDGVKFVVQNFPVWQFWRGGGTLLNPQIHPAPNKDNAPTTGDSQ